MTRQEFIDTVTTLVNDYIGAPGNFDSNPQLRVNPELMQITIINGSQLLQAIEYSDEAIESAAAVEGDASESATDYQASQNPDFYPMFTLTKRDSNGKQYPSAEAISKVADIYFD